MSNSEFTKPRGRPRLYDSPSEKLSAFRARLEQAGYVRREVLVTRRSEERVKALAEEQNVKPLDVYSALVEYGLDAYQREHGATSSTLSGAALLDPATGPAAFPPARQRTRQGRTKTDDDVSLSRPAFLCNDRQPFFSRTR